MMQIPNALELTSPCTMLQEAANHLDTVSTWLIGCRNITSGRGHVVLNQVIIVCVRHGLDVGPLFGISQDVLFHKLAVE